MTNSSQIVILKCMEKSQYCIRMIYYYFWYYFRTLSLIIFELKSKSFVCRPASNETSATVRMCAFVYNPICITFMCTGILLEVLPEIVLFSSFKCPHRKFSF